MTPKIIELKQTPVVLVELPVNFSEPTGISLGPFSDWSVQNLDTGEYHGLGQDLKTMGVLSDLTEDQFNEIDELHHQGDIDFSGDGYYYSFNDTDNLVCETAKQSFYSLLESENVYTENPYGVTYKRMPESDMDYRSFLKWHEAQSRTIDPARTIILLKNKS